MPSPKNNHSMIYLNDEYILIIGVNEISTYIYRFREQNETIIAEKIICIK